MELVPVKGQFAISGRDVVFFTSPLEDKLDRRAKSRKIVNEFCVQKVNEVMLSGLLSH